MTQKDKELLFQDLCARLPYGVMVLEDIDKTFDGVADWLKSLKYRVQPQHKQEWSEADEEMINDIIRSLPKMANGSIEMLPSQAEEYASRLKSLRPQNRWKPSDEQIEALHDTIIYVKDSMFPSKNVLKKLYGQLKKLREA